jgi:hypothetical protein
MNLAQKLLLKNTLIISKMDELNDFGQIWLEELLDLSVLLEFEEVHEKTLELVKKTKLGDPLKHAFTSLPPLSQKEILNREIEVKNELLSRKYKLEELKDQFKENNKKGLFEHFHNCSIHGFEEALEGDYEKAFLKCQTKQGQVNEESVEFIIALILMDKKFDLAAHYKKLYVKKEFSIYHLNFVEVIERATSGDWQNAIPLFYSIYPTLDCIQSNFLFAKGFAGLMPYEYYPFNEEWEWQS